MKCIKMILLTMIAVEIFMVPLATEGAKIRGPKGKAAYPPVIDKTLKAAEKCAPQSDAKGTRFCTGFKVTMKEIDDLTRGGKTACVEKVQSAGYTVLTKNDDQKISKLDWDNFNTSTQTALTFQSPKVVAMKEKATFVDCMHEWIHVLQWTRANDKLLSPRNRERVFNDVEKSVTQQVDKIQELESSGLKAHAIIQAGKAQEAIDRLKDFRDLSESLDEIEAHVFVMRNCERLKCSEEDRETALANLFKRKSALAPKLRAEVEAKARGLIEAKKREAIGEASKSWKPLDHDETAKIVEEKLKEEWPVLVRQMARSGVRLVAIDTSVVAREIGEKIPSEVLVALPSPSREDLDLVRESKILTGSALAKFICTGKKGFKPAIFVTPNSTRPSLVHEYLHVLQSQKNPEYCRGVFGQREVDAEFNQGKMDRKTHDAKLLAAQALNALAEKEVYGFLLEQKSLVGKPESLNNELMLNSVEDWLKTEP